MSRRRRVDDDDEEDDDEEAEDPPEEEDVEYFVDPEEPDDPVRTSVPKPLQPSQSSNSAPSTFVVVSEDFSAPHISHWGIPDVAGTR